MSNDSDRSFVPRPIEGVETLVSTEPGEIFVDVPATNARYVRVEEGETIQEGDIRSHSAEELASDSLRKWTVETIGPETVIGTDRETGERREWNREELEHTLAIGGLSTNLSGFERATVGGASDGSNGDSVSVTVYGNDGRKFTQTYRPVDETDRDERRLELAAADERVETFDDDVRERFDSTVALALRNEGYAV